MRRLVLTACMLAASIGIGACRKKPAAKPEEARPTVHQFCLDASPNLNHYDNQSHTLYVRLFQLSALDAFAQAEVGRLLDPTFVPPGVEGPPMERTVYPGSRVTIPITPRPQATDLGVVAGYYRLTGSAKATRPMAEAGNGRCMMLGPNGIDSR
jgi:type VI secretion system VasD/TssJ family lipoprotein